MLTEPGEHPVNEDTIRQAEENLAQVERFRPANHLGSELQVVNRAQIRRWIVRARALLEGSDRPD